jgi:hypothetical protein
MANESEILRIDLSDTVAQIAALQKQLAALNAEQQQVAETTGENSAEYEALGLQISVTRKELSQTRAAGQAIIEQNKAQTGSLKQLKAELRQAELAYNNLSKAERETGAEGKRLRQTQLDLRTALKAAEGATGDFRRNVGDYRNAIKEAGAEVLAQSPILNTLVSNFKSVTTIVKGANLGFTAATGGATRLGVAIRIGLLGPLSLLIAAFAGIIAFFTRTKEGSDKLAQGLAFLQGLFNGLVKVVAEFGKIIVDAFSNPQKFLDLLVENFVNRFKALGDAALAVGDILKGVFTLDTKLAQKGLADFGRSQVQLVTGLSKENQKAIADTLLASGKAYAETEKRIQAVEARQRSLLKINAELKNEVERLDKASDNANLSFNEREIAAQKAIKTQTQLNNNNIAVIKEQIAIAKIRQKVDGETTENLEEIAKLEGEIVSAVQEGNTKIFDLTNKLSNIRISERVAELNGQKADIEARLELVEKASEAELQLKKDLVAKTVEIEASAAGLTQKQRKAIIAKGDAEIAALDKEFRNEQARANIELINQTIDKELAAVEAGTFERLELEKQANQIKLTNALALLELEEKSVEEKNAAILKLNNDFIKSQADLDKQISDKLKKEKETEVSQELERLKLIQSNEQIAFEERLQAQFDQLELEKQQRLDAAIANGEAVANIEEEFRQRSIKLSADADKQKADNEIKDAQAVFGFLTQLNDIAYEADIKAAGDNAEEKAKIDKAYAARQKRLKLFEIVLNQSAAIAKTLADTPTPANFAFAVAVGAQIAALIGQVASLAFNKGGRVPGHGDTDTVHAMLTPGEVVINKRAAAANLGLLDSINRSTGGAALIPQRLNTGGIVLPVSNISNSLSTEDLVAAFNLLPKPVVTVQAINRAQRNNVEVRQTATL